MMGTDYPFRHGLNADASCLHVAVSSIHASARLAFSLLAWLSFFLSAIPASGQLSGIKNIPGDYATLAIAITDLNAQGVGTGGVTLNLIAGNPQTAPAGGYVVGGTGSLLLTTAAMSNPVILQGNGNTITAPVPQASGLLTDALFKIIGADWITVDGFDLVEAVSNANLSAETNDMTEWGIALLYEATTNGSQNIKLQNNTIDLNRNYQNTFGIYANATHTAFDVTDAATAGSGGGNTGLKIFSNTITDVNHGIIVVGPTASANHNDNVEIGTSGNGNIISNYGTSNAHSNYVNLASTVNGILVRNTKNFIVSNNTITSSNGEVTGGAIYGIHIPAFNTVPTGSFTNTINSNIISLKSGTEIGTINGIAVGSATASTSSSININQNEFLNFGHTVAGSADINFISNLSPAKNISISNNSFINISVNTTGSVTLISNDVTSPASGVKNVNDNVIVTGFSKTGVGGTMTCIKDNVGADPSTAVNNVKNNVFSNISVTGSASVIGISHTNNVSGMKVLHGNIVSNITGGSGAIFGLNINNDAGTTTISSNTISNITGSVNITGINFGSAGAGTTNAFQNLIHSFSGSGAFAVSGVFLTGNNTSTTRNIYQNKIYNLENTNTGGFINGIWVQGGFAMNVFNNLIGDLRTPSVNAANALNGINITSTISGATINVSYNTIYLNATSTGANFGSSGIFHAASATPATAALNLRNNIIVNLSVPKGSGVTAAYRRSAVSLANFGAVSNNNIYYAGTPAAGRAIFYDGTNQDIQLADYKARVSPRDADSFTEHPVFISTSGGNAGFLHLNTSFPTQAESGAVSIAGILTDYDIEVRHGASGYMGLGSAPDIGADEGDFSEAVACNGAEGGTASGSIVFCISGVPNITASGYSVGIGTAYQWQSSVDSSFTIPVDMPGQTDPAALNTGTVSTTTYYRLKVTCAAGTALDYSNKVEVAVNGLVVENTNDTGKGSLRDVIICAPSGSTITFAPALSGQTIVLTSGEIDIVKNLVISGLGASSLAVSGNNISRVFHLGNGFQLTLTDVTLINGSSVTDGGAIFTEGSLILENVTLENNFENGIPKSLTILPPGSLQIFGNVNIND